MNLIIGAGAVGTTLAALLAEHGQPVTLYARAQDEARFSAAGGLWLARPGQTPPGQRLALPPRTHQLDLQGVDAAYLCTKAAALPALLAELPARLPDGCRLLCTLNGVRALHQVKARFPGQAVRPMSILFNAQLDAPLQARLTTRARAVIGDAEPDLLARFAGSGLAVRAAEGETAVWGKLLINLANAIGALTQSTFQDLFQDRVLRRLYAAVLDEATGVLAAAGIRFRLPVAFPYPAYRWSLTHGGPLPWWMARLANGLDRGAYPSMVADVRAGRVTEVAELNGEIVRQAEACGREAPLNRGLVDRVGALRHPPARLSPAALARELGV
ncbi:MAG TPA: 2-dehydropantoate 2-reductase N-terminal domain-containing protein [Nevskiaceae bacterium]|nr:2-dehydropantoate 2-reductase N-terminal domain-containing protein [Nevskiaceae bacterium]